MNFYIGDYEVRTATYEVLYKNRLQQIEPLVFKLLNYMLEHPDRVLSRDELMNEIWSSRVISDSALSAAICAARHAIGDTGKKQRCIKTVSGHGYRFIAQFTCTESNDVLAKNKPIQMTNCLTDTIINVTAPYTEKESALSPLTLPDKPSIAVMDFVDLSEEGKGALLAYGLASEVNSGLARLPHFFVIARDSATVLAKQGLSAQTVGRQLGVRYLVYANIEKLPKRVQVTLSLIDAVQNTEIWSEHFDRSYDDIAPIRDAMISTIVFAIDSAIEQAEIERAFLTHTENLSAWENYHRGLWHIDRTTIADVDAAQQFFQQAIALEPRFSRACAGLAYTYVSRHLLNDVSTEKNDNVMQKAYDYAQRSLDYCPHEAMGYMVFGRALFFDKRYKQALQMHDHGLQHNPNDVHCHYLKGVSSLALGMNRQAQQYLDKAERLSPFNLLQFSVHMVRAVSLANQKKYEDAVEASLRATYYDNAYFSTYAIATACLQLAGRTEQAQQYATKVLTLKPNYSTELYQCLTPHADEKTRALFINAMQSAGIPERSTVH